MSAGTFSQSGSGPQGRPAAPPPRRYAVGSYPRYEQARQVVDHLSDRGFPVQTVTIVGADLRMVGPVTGRLTPTRAALAGAASTGWLGLLFGLFVGIFAASGTGVFVLGTYGLLWGAGAGAVLGVAAHAAARGTRVSSRVRGLGASRYDVLVEATRATEAELIVGEIG